jgi:putative transcriptional regulator
VDVRAVREGLGLTQLEFAARFGLDPDAVQNWEQGRTRPDRNARILLRVIATAPEAVEEALG